MAETSAGAPQAPKADGPVPDAIIDGVEVELEAFIGKVRMTVADLRKTRRDDLLTLETKLNEAVELRLNGHPIARGEVVAVGSHYGIRLTEIVS